MTHSFKPLPLQIMGKGEVKGFKFNQISKTSNGYCYEVNSGDNNIHYEVFRRKINKRFNCESYPTAKAFGSWAYTFRDKEKAMNKLISL